MSNKLAMRCYVSGKVQGVWYRAFAKKEAEQLGIRGFARNLADGRVEVWAIGEADSLDLFYHQLKQGPDLAKVEELTREELPWKDYEGFDTF